MKDLSLSLLSRGCARFVSTNRNTGRHDGRLDVCFTPQDYYIWKSQDSLLRLSNSGHLLVEAESAIPKTYSTRRGPLLLYSQDLVTMETGCLSETREKKQRRYTHQVEQLSTLKELSAAILSYSDTQFTSSRLNPLLCPPLHLPPAPDLHCPSPLPLRTTQEQPSPDFLVQLNPQWLPAERITEQLENQPEDNAEEQSSRKRVRLDLFLQIPCTSRSPTPQMEPRPWVHYAAKTPDEPEKPQTYVDMSLRHTENIQNTEINHHSIGGELQHPKKWVHDVADDQRCSIQDSGTTGDEDNYEKSISGKRPGRIGLLPPLTVGHSVSNGPCWEKTDRGPSRDEHHARRLPPIAESRSFTPGWAIPAQTGQDAQPKAERVGFQSQENLNILHQQPLVLPLLFPGKKEEISGNQRGGGEKTERQYYIKETVEQGGGGGGGGGAGGGGGLPSEKEKGSMILLEPGEEPPPPVGLLGCVAGRKGPGKQSSLAFLQNRLLDLQDPCDSSEANRGVVRGVLPLELRDLQNGKSVGSLILGPDGEIIQLSLYDNSQDPSHTDGDTQERALQVLSAEGEKLPWVIVLQPEHTHTEGEVELNIDGPVGDIQYHQSIHKLLDLPRDQQISETNACSPTRLTDPAAVTKKTKKKPKGAEAVAESWEKDAENNVRMPLLRERVGKEEPTGGNTEAEEEDEEEELGRIGPTSHFPGSHQPGQQNTGSNEATTEDAVNKWRKNPKRKVTEERAATTRKRETKTVKGAASDGQKTSMTRREGRRQREKTGSDAQSIRSQKQEERTNREAAETRDQSALPSVKKKMTDRERERRGVKMNEEREEQGEEARQKEESAGRRRRKGRLKHKELVVGKRDDPLEKEEVEISQELEEKSQLKSTKRPSATQRHNNNTKTNSEAEEDTDTEHFSTNADQHSSVQSVSSLWSAAAASQFSQRSSKRSAASSCEEAVPASAVGLASSRGCLSSCSTVMVTEEQLMLNPAKPESSTPQKSQEKEEEAAALRLAQRAERRRQEVERKRREREEEERKRQEKEQTEERMKTELEGERRKRAEELRLKKLVEEDERRKHEEEKQEQVKREQAQRERERRRQEERRRQMELLRRMREEEEQRRKAELECLRLEEERKQEEENKKLQEMDERERIDYLCRKEQEEENRRSKEEERKRREEEAALQAAEEAKLQAELLARQMVLLQQQLAFKRGLMLEAGGLEKTQGISRPWIYSYFTLLQLLGLNPTKAETTTP
ncbi:uncharacterized protein LOC120570452 isoform X1 [Perca fluviatilis]|uniref:uncharacterized protein LOC120570452 isoform X1 n=1 Tax=Perca fluviatilis TaxID=8168 RepID=UPI00196328F1|nr:uncharacterized protein LOC120570452 isoform X1 [Perca fluviatilis]